MEALVNIDGYVEQIATLHETKSSKWIYNQSMAQERLFYQWLFRTASFSFFAYSRNLSEFDYPEVISSAEKMIRRNVEINIICHEVPNPNNFFYSKIKEISKMGIYLDIDVDIIKFDFGAYFCVADNKMVRFRLKNSVATCSLNQKEMAVLLKTKYYKILGKKKTTRSLIEYW